MPKPRDAVPSYRLYGDKSDASPDFWIHCETVPERTHLHNFEIAEHRHEALFQIFRLTAGSGELLTRDATTAFAAPCAIFLPPSAAHGFRFARDVDGFVITALADRLATLAAADRQIEAFARHPRILPLDAEDGTKAATALDAIDREMRGTAPARAVLLDALTTAAIVSLVRASGDADTSAGMADDRDGRRIRELSDLIAVHFREHRPVAFYAGRLGVSPTHLNRLARRETGHSVSALIANRVVEAARRDLVFTPTPVQKIAYSLGFSDPAYFNRFFRRMTGVTPGAYREAERRRLVA